MSGLGATPVNLIISLACIIKKPELSVLYVFKKIAIQNDITSNYHRTLCTN